MPNGKPRTTVNWSNDEARRAYWAEHGRKGYARRREKGLCARAASHGPAAPDRSYCQPCIDAAAEKARAAYQAANPRARVNTCRGCGKAGHNILRCTELARREERGAA